MKKYSLYLVVSLTALAAIFLLVAFDPTGGARINYPSFAQSQSEPQVVVELERDFAYRTGDPITFTVFVDQQAGTAVDETSFAVTDTNAGDMEYSSTLLDSKSLPNGSRLLAVQVTLRKWSYEQSFTVAATMSYIVSETGDTKALAVPAITLHMSPTWDGRKTLNQGDAQLVKDSEAILNIILIGVGLGISIFALAYIRRARRNNSLARARQPRVLTKLEQARQRYELVRDLIEGRDFRLAHYEELERIVRELFAVEALSTEKVVGALDTERSWANADVVTILTGCDERLYQGSIPTTAEHTEIFRAFDRLIAEMPQREVAPQPRVTRLTPLLTRLQRLPHKKLRFLAVVGGWLYRHRPFRYYV